MTTTSVIRQWMDEAAAPDALRQQTFYHGTSDEGKGQKILDQGIVPGNQDQKARGHLTPMLGRSYLTPTLRYGVIYCIGGDMLGCSEESAKHLANRKNRHGSASRYGWLFVITGQQLADDVQPDEDSVGGFISDHTTRDWDQTTKPWRRLPPAYKPDGVEDDRKRVVWHNIRSAMTDRQFYGSIEGEYSAWASGGKRALKYLSDRDKLALIRWGAHVAYRGVLVPDQAWRFDKLDASRLTHDGSNFFSLAERIR